MIRFAFTRLAFCSGDFVFRDGTAAVAVWYGVQL